MELLGHQDYDSLCRLESENDIKTAESDFFSSAHSRATPAEDGRWGDFTDIFYVFIC